MRPQDRFGSRGRAEPADREIDARTLTGPNADGLHHVEEGVIGIEPGPLVFLA
jgi:hypothetical protein